MSRKNVSMLIFLFSVLFFSDSAFCGKRWIDPRFSKLSKEEYWKSFARLSDGSVVLVDDNSTKISHDDGKTWSEPRPIYTGPGPGVPTDGGHLVSTPNDVLILVYGDIENFKFSWHNARGEPADDSELDVWSIRSLDRGKTWVDRQMLLDGYCGAFQAGKLLSNGYVVVAIQNMIKNPGRSVTATYVTEDNGKTWTRSNIIDLGGNGHHDGAFESTIIELKDGRLWMLLRTNWDYFWEAFSYDHGHSWRTIRRSKIDASSSPGYLYRLSSGRLVLLWNRLYPEGKDYFAPYGDRTYASVAASWHREELSIAFSENEGKTWTEPIILAYERGEGTQDARIAYPSCYERKPGLLHIKTVQGHLRVEVRESDLIQ